MCPYAAISAESWCSYCFSMKKFCLLRLKFGKQGEENMSGTLAVCHITDEVRDRLKKFRFSKETTMQAIILKISREEQNMEVEEYLEDCSIDEVKDELPQQQPRFILLSYAMKHQDGRTSYPMCLIFFSPSGCSPEQQMLYAGSRNSLVNECQLTKNFEIRDIDEFTQEFVDAKVV